MSQIFIDDFYHRLEEVCRIIDESPCKFVVSSIGKQSRGKSYFLNRVFDPQIPIKESKNASRGTSYLHHSQLPEFHLLDMEGIDSSPDYIPRDIFNFFSIMTISDVVLLNISHRDLEDIKFIDEFGFMLYQAFSPSKSTCFSFRLNMPKILLFIRDPRWDSPEGETLLYYENLVKEFTNSVTNILRRLSDEIISLFEIEDLKKEKMEDEKLKLKENYIKIRKTVEEYSFFIDKTFIIYNSQTGMGDSKTIKYYELKMVEDVYDFVESNYTILNDYILDLKSKCIKKQKIEDLFSVDIMTLLGNDNQHIDIIKTLNEFKKSQECYVNTIKNVYIEVKFDVFCLMENINQIKTFIEKFYSVKAGIDEMITETFGKITWTNEFKGIQNRSNRKRQQVFENLRAESMKNFKNIISENGLNDHENSLLNYFRLLLVKRFSNIFCLNGKIKDSILYTTLFAILLFDKQDIINKELDKIDEQLSIFECTCFYGEEFQEILKSTYRNSFMYFDAFISVKVDQIKAIIKQNSLGIDLNNLRFYEIENMKWIPNTDLMIKPFINFIDLDLDKIDDYSNILQPLLDDYLAESSENITGRNIGINQKIEVSKEEYIQENSIIKTLLPSLRDLLTGISSIRFRSQNNGLDFTFDAKSNIKYLVMFLFSFVSNIFKPYKVKKTSQISLKYTAPENYKILDYCKFNCELNGNFSETDIKKIDNHVTYDPTFISDGNICNSAFGVVYLFIILEPSN